MKKFLALFLAIIIAITLVSCLDQKDTPTPAPGGENGSTTTTTQKDYTPKKLEGFSSGGSGEPPITISFDSIQEVQDFIKAANGTEEEFEKYRDSKEDLYYYVRSQKVAQAMAHNMDIIDLPLMPSKTPDETFRMEYCLSYNTFEVIYGDGVYFKYRFIYFYNKNTLPLIEDQPIKENVTIGPYSLDLYEETGTNGRLVGCYLDKSVCVSVRINTVQFGDLPLDIFNMAPIESVK